MKRSRLKRGARIGLLVEELLHRPYLHDRLHGVHRKDLRLQGALQGFGLCVREDKEAVGPAEDGIGDEHLGQDLAGGGAVHGVLDDADDLKGIVGQTERRGTQCGGF